MITAAAGRKDSSGNITFDNPRQLLLSSNNIDPLAWSAPAVAADDRFFYLAVSQKQGGNFQAVIYRSLDNVAWSEFLGGHPKPASRGHLKTGQ